MVECEEEESRQFTSREYIKLDEINDVPAKLVDLVKVLDSLLEVNLGKPGEHCPTYVSKLMDLNFQAWLIQLLRECPN